MLDDRPFFAFPPGVPATSTRVFYQFSQDNPVSFQSALFGISERHYTVQNVECTLADALDESVIGCTNERGTLTIVRVTESVQESHLLFRVPLPWCNDYAATSALPFFGG